MLHRRKRAPPPLDDLYADHAIDRRRGHSRPCPLEGAHLPALQACEDWRPGVKFAGKLSRMGNKSSSRIALTNGGSQDRDQDAYKGPNDRHRADQWQSQQDTITGRASTATAAKANVTQETTKAITAARGRNSRHNQAAATAVGSTHHAPPARKRRCLRARCLRARCLSFKLPQPPSGMLQPLYCRLQ